MTSGDNHQNNGKTGDEAVAVALDYDPMRDRAPKVVAGGRGEIAEQILQIAFANGVRVREDADLAELLSSIDIETDIPTEAFAAVAEILIYVYRANGNWPAFLDEAMGGEAPHRDPGAQGLGEGPGGGTGA